MITAATTITTTRTIQHLTRCTPNLRNGVIQLQNRPTAPAAVCSHCHSYSTDFFTYNSRRQRRRRQKLQAKERRRHKKDDNDESKLKELEQDNRTAMDIIWPNPYKGETNPYAFPKPRNWHHFKTAVTAAWRDYLWTWKGFRQPGFLVPDIEEYSAADEILNKKQKPNNTLPDDPKTAIQQNIQRNTQFLQENAQQLKQELKDRTGIQNKEDVRQLATLVIKTVTHCVNEFLAGYRKGRDDEVENMLTKYFSEFQQTHLDTNTNKRRRRRTKRRTQRRYQRL